MTHFVPCFFLGVITLLFIAPFLPNQGQQLTDIHFEFDEIILPLVNGLIVAILVVCFHLFRNYRIQIGKALFMEPTSKKVMLQAACIGFLGGAFEILFAMLNEGLIALTILVLSILIWHIRVFYKDIITMLKPGNHATWTEVAELVRIYFTMLAGFTLLNATLEVSHMLLNTTLPFGFGTSDGQFFINSLYFTVVTMTTLGFGDIVPQTGDGKLLVIFQCLVSYVMFALMVGIITRGVTRARDEIENQ